LFAGGLLAIQYRDASLRRWIPAAKIGSVASVIVLAVLMGVYGHLDYHDAAAGSYRAAHVVKESLAACLFISRRPDLPERAWLAGLFEREKLSATERVSLLAGRPPGAREDVGPMVCSCFAVGRNTLRRTIAQHALTDTQQVGARLRAGTNCGSCLPEIRALLAEIDRAECPTPAGARYADTV